VDAAIEPVGLTSQQDMDVPRDPRNVGWYSGGPAPGQTGNAVIDGHLNWTSGPAVFWNLDKLRVGAQIQVTDASGHTVVFHTANSVTYPIDQPPPPGLFRAGGGERRLALITCAGDWTDTGYSKRLVVEAQFASDEGVTGNAKPSG
jgi:sortase A